jgi:ribosome recycling factor
MIPEIKKAAEDKMKKTIETLRNDLGKIRTGRAHAGMLDHIMVDYYGTPTALTGVANVNLLDARTIGVTPWERKMVSTIEKAIRDSDLGLNPSAVGKRCAFRCPR